MDYRIVILYRTIVFRFGANGQNTVLNAWCENHLQENAWAAIASRTNSKFNSPARRVGQLSFDYCFMNKEDAIMFLLTFPEVVYDHNLRSV